MAEDQSLESLLHRLDQLSDEFGELRDGFRKAVRIADEDPEMALTRARKVLEYVVRDVYRRRCQEEPGTRPLENLLQRLVRDGHLPRKVGAYANGIRELGNVGTHTFGERVSMGDVRHSLVQLMTVLEWYFESERPEAAPIPAETATKKPSDELDQHDISSRAERTGLPGKGDAGLTGRDQESGAGISRKQRRKAALARLGPVRWYAYAMAVVAESGVCLLLRYDVFTLSSMKPLSALPLPIYIQLAWSPYYLSGLLLGIVFGFEWPRFGWKWGLFLSILPVVFFLQSFVFLSSQSYPDASTLIAMAVSRVVFILVYPIFSSIGARWGARYKIRRQERETKEQLRSEG